MKRILLILSVLMPCMALAQNNELYRDWANFGRYAQADEQLTASPSVVFMGDSILDGWDDRQPEYFTSNNFACRAISGQVTSQMLVRFRADVLNLKPEAVVILAGTNDLALNNGYIENEHIVENIMSMVELAKNAGIRPILCSLLPASRYGWRPEVENVAEKIIALNALLKAYAEDNNVMWVDLHQAMAEADGAMNTKYTDDCVHPTLAGYDKMREVLYPYLRPYIIRAHVLEADVDVLDIISMKYGDTEIGRESRPFDHVLVSPAASVLGSKEYFALGPVVYTITGGRITMFGGTMYYDLEDPEGRTYELRYQEKKDGIHISFRGYEMICR